MTQRGHEPTDPMDEVARLARRFDHEVRAEAAEYEALAARDLLRHRTLRDAALEHLVRKAVVTVDAATRSFTGTVLHVGEDLARIRGAAAQLDLRLSAPCLLRVGPASGAAPAGSAGAPAVGRGEARVEPDIGGGAGGSSVVADTGGGAGGSGIDPRSRSDGPTVGPGLGPVSRSGRQDGDAVPPPDSFVAALREHEASGACLTIGTRLSCGDVDGSIRAVAVDHLVVTTPTGDTLHIARSAIDHLLLPLDR